MYKYFYKNPTFTDTTWAILSITRFFLAFIVMISIGHLTHLVHFSNYPLLFQKITSLGGKAAVMGFLFISGISIGYSYYKNEEGFIKRRFLRIYPLYFFAVLFAVFLQYYLGSPYELPGVTMVAAGNLTSLSNFLLLQGIASIDITYNGPLWSISVEFLLYLLVPLLFRFHLRYVFLVLITSMFLFTFQESIISEIELYGFKTAIYAWPFILGFLISAKKQIKYTIPFLIIGTGSIIYNVNLMQDRLCWFTFLSVVLVVFFSIYVNLNLSQRTRKILNFLGTISYPMYLFHIPLYLLLYYFGVFIIVIPINYVLDDYLKKVFWKPLVNTIEKQIKDFTSKRIFIKTF
jgi:peptidoglycan/LPS O-acetylase OafA/YrhL